MPIPADLQFANAEDLTWVKHIPSPHFVTGSRVCLETPDLASDIDIVILFNSHPEGKAYLSLNGFETDLKFDAEDYGMTHHGRSWRRGNINVIEVWEKEYYTRWALATYLAQQLKPPTRKDRIALFKAVRDNNYSDLLHYENNWKFLPEHFCL